MSPPDAGRRTAGLLGVVKPKDTRSECNELQSVGEVGGVEGDGQRLAGEIDRQVLLGAADVVGACRQPQHTGVEFHPT